MKFERSGKVFRHVTPVVTAGIQMELVGDVASVQQIVKCLGTGVEAVFVLRTAIKINFQSVQMRAVFYKSERAVLIPVGRVGRRPERGAENPRKHGPLITRHPAGG